MTSTTSSDTPSGQSSKPDKPSSDTPTASSGESLSYAQLQDAWNALPHTDITELALIAPNKKIAKQWRKEYPGITVIEKTKYSGYPILKPKETP